MQMTDIHNLTKRLMEGGGDIEFAEDGSDTTDELFAEALKEMLRNAEDDYYALFTFFDIAADFEGARHDWEPDELKGLFEERFRGSNRDAVELLKEYYENHEDPQLGMISRIKTVADYFQWEEYTADQRPDLTLKEHGPMHYLFED